MLAGSECGGKNSAKSYHKRTYIGLRVQQPLFLSDFNETRIFDTFSHKQYSYIKLNENSYSGNRVVPCGQTDITKLVVNLVNKAKLVHKVSQYVYFFYINDYIGMQVNKTYQQSTFFFFILQKRLKLYNLIEQLSIRSLLVCLTLWPWKRTFKQWHIIYVKCEYFTNQKM